MPTPDPLRETVRQLEARVAQLERGLKPVDQPFQHIGPTFGVFGTSPQRQAPAIAFVIDAATGAQLATAVNSCIAVLRRFGFISG